MRLHLLRFFDLTVGSHALTTLAGGLSLALLAGCTAIKPLWESRDAAAFRPTNFVATGPMPGEIRRVGVLPMHSDQWSAAELNSVEAAFLGEFRKTARFEVIEISRSAVNARFGRESLASTAALPADLLSRLREDFGVDALLFLDCTHFAPYQPVALGIRAKLVPTATPGTLWSLDCLFDAARPEVANSARQYQLAESRPSYPMENTSGILLSPARFAKYAAWATFDTIPARKHE